MPNPMFQPNSTTAIQPPTQFGSSMPTTAQQVSPYPMQAGGGANNPQQIQQAQQATMPQVPGIPQLGQPGPVQQAFNNGMANGGGLSGGWNSAMSQMGIAKSLATLCGLWLNQ